MTQLASRWGNLRGVRFGESRALVCGMCQTMNRGWIAAAGQDGASCVLAEPGDPKTVIVQGCSRTVLADLCATAVPGMRTNRYQRDAA
jgi:hypothetical protein